MSENNQSELRAIEIRKGKRERQRSSYVTGRCVRMRARDPYSCENDQQDIDRMPDLADNQPEIRSLDQSEQNSQSMFISKHTNISLYKYFSYKYTK
jgi:hypothetical protein